tara:strand:+ start:39 stop:923 length:885 start_codon:yes stop_codon:yes gene_type:complete
MTSLLISNINSESHFEIIESVIVKRNEFFKENLDSNINIYIILNYNISENKSFIDYIQKKYPKIIFLSKGKTIKNPDYFINCTIYDNLCGFPPIEKQDICMNTNSNKKYISHNFTSKTKENPNIFYLTPFSNKNYFKADILPFSDEKYKSEFPIYVVQGSFDKTRRNYKLLTTILSRKYKYKFKIRLIGKGKFPKELENYKQYIEIKNNLNFVDYHKEFLDVFCILPLITKKTHPHYYNNKLTSTINYINGYNLKCLIDKDLQYIYNLDNVEIFINENDIATAFERTLEDFYRN